MIVADVAQIAVDIGNTLTDAIGPITPTLLAAEPNPPAPVINTDAVIDFITTKIAPILLAALGVIFISRAGKGEMSKVLTSSAIAIMGLAFIAGATIWFFFGKKLVDLIFG